jgi:hypothetical protein
MTRDTREKKAKKTREKKAKKTREKKEKKTREKKAKKARGHKDITRKDLSSLLHGVHIPELLTTMVSSNSSLFKKLDKELYVREFFEKHGVTVREENIANIAKNQANNSKRDINKYLKNEVKIRKFVAKYGLEAKMPDTKIAKYAAASEEDIGRYLDYLEDPFIKFGQFQKDLAKLTKELKALEADLPPSRRVTRSSAKDPSKNNDKREDELLKIKAKNGGIIHKNKQIKELLDKHPHLNSKSYRSNS